METARLKTRKIRTIIISFLFIAISSCSFQPRVEIKIVEISTSEHEIADYIYIIRYQYITKNNTKMPLTIKDSYIKKTFDPKVEGLEPADLNVLTNVFLLFQGDTVWGNRNILGGNHIWELTDTTIKKHVEYEDLFVLQSWLLEQQYRDRYGNCYETEKDFRLDVVKKGILCVEVANKIYRIKNSLPITYMEDGEHE